MKTYSFSLMLLKVDEDLEMDDVADLLYETGCNDGTYGVYQGVHIIDFDREAESFDTAVESAVKDVLNANVCEDCVPLQSS